MGAGKLPPAPAPLLAQSSNRDALSLGHGHAGKGTRTSWMWQRQRDARHTFRWLPEGWVCAWFAHRNNFTCWDTILADLLESKSEKEKFHIDTKFTTGWHPWWISQRDQQATPTLPVTPFYLYAQKNHLSIKRIICSSIHLHACNLLAERRSTLACLIP